MLYGESLGDGIRGVRDWWRRVSRCQATLQLSSHPRFGQACGVCAKRLPVTERKIAGNAQPACDLAPTSTDSPLGQPCATGAVTSISNVAAF